jgi:hypothetical protein
MAASANKRLPVNLLLPFPRPVPSSHLIWGAEITVSVEASEEVLPDSTVSLQG